ncbi:hypothetical protein HZS_2616 [Henneguya salminicola]|nr:hypothetical protein HZS_2616 [Henneguya salminicola]
MVALNDEDVKRQIDHMVSFIYQEANEKVQEIEARAEEEFNIEKGKLVQQERLRIINYYEKKEKNLSLLKKITHSQCLNNSRIEILKAQDDIINEVLKEAKNVLLSISKGSEYTGILSKLLLQALYQVLEQEVTVFCRETDINLIKKILPEIKSNYELETKQQLNIKIEDINFLDSDIAGGIEVSTPDGRIKVNNTLDKRLELVTRQVWCIYII